MMELAIRIDCPDLADAMRALAKALNRGGAVEDAPQQKPASQLPQAAPVSISPTVPMTTTSAPATVPISQPAPTVPTAAPAYTMEQITKAGADLAQAGKLPQLLSLLQQFNVQAVTQVPADQYGAFATALRGLGAQL